MPLPMRRTCSDWANQLQANEFRAENRGVDTELNRHDCLLAECRFGLVSRQVFQQPGHSGLGAVGVYFRWDGLAGAETARRKVSLNLRQEFKPCFKKC